MNSPSPGDNPPALNEPLLSNTNRTSTSPSTMTLSFHFTAAVLLAALPMLLFGFHTGVLNAPESVIFPGHSTAAWSLAVSAFCVGGFLGSANAGRSADHYGRRFALLAILMGNFLFGLLHVVAPNMLTLILARVGVGVAGGAATVLTPLYLAEIAPAEIKGSIGTLTQLSCVLGILASVLYALPFCHQNLWRWIFVPLPVTSLLGMLLAIRFLPESPRWLLLHHYQTRGEEARAIIQQFRNFHSGTLEQAVEMEVLLMTNSISTASLTDSPQPTPSTPTTTTTTTTASTTFAEFALDPRNRIPLVSAILFPVAQQLSGINAVFYYSTLFFDGVMANPRTGTIVAFAVNVIATLVALVLMDRLGRKTLLAVSAGGMAFGCILLTLSLQGILPPLLTVACVLLYISFFELGLGCIPFFLAGELIEPQFLGTVQSIAMASNWGSNFCVGLFFPYMNQVLGAYSFVPFAVVLVATLVYALAVLPETRGKSLEMVLQELRETATTNTANTIHHQPIAQQDNDEDQHPNENTTLNEVV